MLLTHLVMGEVRFVTSETKAEEAELGEAPCRGGSLFLPLREVRLARVRVRARVRAGVRGSQVWRVGVGLMARVRVRVRVRVRGAWCRPGYC